MKKINIHSTILLVFITSTLFLGYGCKSKKIVDTSGKLESKSHSEILADALSAEVDYKTISAKGNVEFKTGDASQKVPAVFKIIKDQAVQISVRIPIIGGEAMRMTITTDSIILIDRLKKKYIAEDFKSSQIISNFDFNFYNLQALFTNKIFIPGKPNLSKNDHSKFNISATPECYILQTKGKANMLYNFAVSAKNHLESTMIRNEKKDVTLQWIYSDFITDNNQTYPTYMNAKVDFSKKHIDVGFSYSKLDIDKEITIDNSIPSKYTKVDFFDLLGSYIKIK